MNGWIIAGIVAAVLVVPPLLVAYSLCRVAADADRMMERLYDSEGDG